jgi:hypothetical protein
MDSYIQSFWQRVGEVQGQVWSWFSGLNREEWLVLLAVVCACGFLSLRGMQSRRL